jgi:hypothetical protein
MDRRSFLARAAAGVGALSSTLPLACDPQQSVGIPPPPHPHVEDVPLVGPRAPYRGPNVILVRFGGGVRRRETVQDPAKTWCPFVLRELASQGVVFNDVEIADGPGIVTSHGQGTLYLLTGQYDHYEDITHQPFADRFEPRVPTLFEYLRRAYDIPAHQALIVNGENRINEEFYTFSNHHQYGVRYRSTVLSLYRFKTYLLRQELQQPDLDDKKRVAKEKQLQQMENKDYRVKDNRVASPELDAFWEDWRGYYGSTGLVNPRGDRVLTALAQRALERLRPRLMMINYQDPDYVHWGPAHFYTRAISIIDEGVRELYHATQADAEYRDNTVFVVVPDCGRDDNRLMSVPFQHHFNTRSAHEIFAVVSGPARWVPQARKPIDRQQHQISVTRLIGDLMGFATPHAAADSLFKNV